MGFFDIFKKKKDEVPPFKDLSQFPSDFGLGQDMAPGMDAGLGDGFSAMNPMQQRSQMPPTLEPVQYGQQQYPGNTFAPKRPYDQPQQSVHNDLINKNIEVISVKIDTLKATIEALNQRIANLENMIRGSQPQEKYRW